MFFYLIFVKYHLFVTFDVITLGHSFLFIGLGLWESLPYDFCPSWKIEFAFQFLFLFYVPAFQI